MNFKESIEVHPWKWYLPANCSVLMVGTFPPVKKRWSYHFFYPNKANLYWSILAEIAGLPLNHFSGEEAVEERKKILDKLNTGITDMGYCIKRKGNTSGDEVLELIEMMDIKQILKTHPGIQKIIFTSSSGVSSAAGWFTKYLKASEPDFTFPKGKKPIKRNWMFEGRNFELVIVHSPSRRAANRFSFAEMVEMYGKEIESRRVESQK